MEACLKEQGVRVCVRVHMCGGNWDRGCEQEGRLVSGPASAAQTIAIQTPS